MPSKKPRTCPICHRPGLINLSQHLSGVHRIGRQERKQLIQRGMVVLEVFVMSLSLISKSTSASLTCFNVESV